jgi:hypothetical protein
LIFHSKKWHLEVADIQHKNATRLQFIAIKAQQMHKRSGEYNNKQWEQLNENQ